MHRTFISIADIAFQWGSDGERNRSIQRENKGMESRTAHACSNYVLETEYCPAGIHVGCRFDFHRAWKSGFPHWAALASARRPSSPINYLGRMRAFRCVLTQ